MFLNGNTRPGGTIEIRTPAELGAAVRERRRQLGLRQEDLALAAGTGRRFIGDVERGKSSAELGGVLGVLVALGLRIQLSDRGTRGTVES